MKSGYVSINGFPNVGKSTLMNSVLKFKRSIVTPAKGTTRNKIIGVYSKKDLEIIFLDSPGFYKPKNKIESFMLSAAYESIDDADVVTLIVDGKENDEEYKYLQNVFKKKKPQIVLFNKIDLYKLPQVEVILKKISENFPDAKIIQTHLTSGFGIEEFLKTVKSMLKEGPSFYQDYDYLKEEEVFNIKEIIREKCLLFLKNEVPHNIAIYINDIIEQGKQRDIDATIFVSKESLKGIVIGHKGSKIKQIRLNAQKDIRENIGKELNLAIDVKVKDNWINDDNQLKKFGYK